MIGEREAFIDVGSASGNCFSRKAITTQVGISAVQRFAVSMLRKDYVAWKIASLKSIKNSLVTIATHQILRN